MRPLLHPRTSRARTSPTFAFALTLLFAVSAAAPAAAFNGPYATLVDAGGGVMVDVDVRWPSTGSAPAAGWPVVFWAHGAGGSKASNAANAAAYADDGYVTLSYTNRADQAEWLPVNFVSDQIALKNWLVNDFEAEAGVSVPVDPDKFGITGNSLGGYTSWSAALLSESFAAVVPFNWGFHAFVDHIVSNGSIEWQTGGGIAGLFPTVEYPADDVNALVSEVLGAAIVEFPNVAIPVMNQLAMLDGRTSGSNALSDHLALTAAPAKMVYLGTGGHGTPNSDGAFRDALREDWFAFHLKGEANGIDGDDPIQVALLVTDEHVSYPSWPPPGATDVTVHLHDGARILAGPPVAAQAGDSLVNDPGTFTYFDAAPSFSVAAIRANLPSDTLVYETASLTEEVLLVGEPSVELYVEGTGSRYQIAVHLLEISDGVDPVLLAYGTATLDQSPALARIALTVTGRRLPAGNRLRLEITNRDDQDVDHTDAYSPETGRLRYIPYFELSTTTVFHDDLRPSSLTLPLIGATELPVASGAPAGSLVTRTLKISGLNKPAGSQRATLKSDPVDATSSAFDPVSEGLSIAVSRTGGAGATLTIAPGDPDWKVSSKGFRWRAKTPVHPQGLSLVKVGKSASVFKLKAKAKDMDATAVTSFTSIDVTLAIGNDVWTGTAPPCALSSSASILQCK